MLLIVLILLKRNVYTLEVLCEYRVWTEGNQMVAYLVATWEF